MIRHIITSEYPPQPGGVSDYTRIVAEGLAAAGDEVHVWCPGLECGDLSPLSEGEAQLDCSREADKKSGVKPPHSKVVVHREMGTFTPRNLRDASRLLDQFPTPRHVLVQWVPHGYGLHSMNIGICLWLWRRALRGDEVELMVHEPSLGFGEGGWKHNLVAAVHRLMTIILLRATRRVWVSIPAWEKRWRPYTLGRAIEFRWLPVGSNIPVAEAPTKSPPIRQRYLNGSGRLVGHFGSYDANTFELLLKSASQLIKHDATLLLMGHGSDQTRAALLEGNPTLANRVHATGSLSAAELSRHLVACDLMLQPYIDGVSSRRTSTMTALAHGVPVVTTTGKFTEPLWTASDAVALAPAHDVDALVRSAAQLLPNEMAKQRLAAAAKKLYEEHFHPRRTIDALREGLETS
ncbi:MAG TPA: glycosyltransferase family 4 protein [Pyrinomonadaceae bacterium]